VGRLNLDRAVLDAKLYRLRKTTKLGCDYPLVVSNPGQEVQNSLSSRIWSAVVLKYSRHSLRHSPQLECGMRSVGSRALRGP
jgi:hypothetical protein